MNESERELVELTEKWMREIKDLALLTEKAVRTLDKMREDYHKKWWEVGLKFIPYIYPILLLIAAFMVIKFSNIKTIDFFGVTITK
jgi:hypothetical protein